MSYDEATGARLLLPGKVAASAKIVPNPGVGYSIIIAIALGREVVLTTKNEVWAFRNGYDFGRWT